MLADFVSLCGMKTTLFVTRSVNHKLVCRRKSNFSRSKDLVLKSITLIQLLQSGFRLNFTGDFAANCANLSTTESDSHLLLTIV